MSTHKQLDDKIKNLEEFIDYVNLSKGRELVALDQKMRRIQVEFEKLHKRITLINQHLTEFQSRCLTFEGGE